MKKALISACLALSLALIGFLIFQSATTLPPVPAASGAKRARQPPPSASARSPAEATDPLADLSARFAASSGREQEMLMEQFVAGLSEAEMLGLLGRFEQDGSPFALALRQEMLARMIALNPAAVARYVMSLPRTASRWQELGYRLVREWAQKDQGAVATYLLGLADEKDKMFLLPHLIPQASTAMVARIADAASRFADQDARFQVMERAVGAWAAAEPEGAIAWAGRLDAEADRREAYCALMQPIAEKQPARALSLIESLPEALQRDSRLLEALVKGWPEAQKEQLSAWVWQRPDNTGKADALTFLVDQFGGPDTQSAIQYAQQQGLQNGTDILQHIAARRWARDEPADAATWATQQPAGQARAAALDAVVSQWAAYHPNEAAMWVSQMQAGEDQIVAAKAAAAGWQSFSGEQALAWVQQFGDAAVRAEAIRAVIEPFTERDRSSAAYFIQKMPDGANKDVALDAYTTVLAYHDAPAARQWAELIQDPALRAQRLAALDAQAASAPAP